MAEVEKGRRIGGNRLLEKVLVNFLDLKGVLNSAPDIVANLAGMHFMRDLL